MLGNHVALSKRGAAGLCGIVVDVGAGEHDAGIEGQEPLTRKLFVEPI
jgi:hypothetical protein